MTFCTLLNLENKILTVKLTFFILSEMEKIIVLKNISTINGKIKLSQKNKKEKWLKKKLYKAILEHLHTLHCRFTNGSKKKANHETLKSFTWGAKEQGIKQNVQYHRYHRYKHAKVVLQGKNNLFPSSNSKVTNHVSRGHKLRSPT